MAARKKSASESRRAELAWMRLQLRKRIARSDEAAAGVASAVRQLRAVVAEIAAIDAEAAKEKKDGLDEIAAQREKRKAATG